MKIDICVAFNDVVPPNNLGMVASNKPSYYEQVIKLVKSIKINWDSKIYPYEIYLFHSRKLEKKKTSFLKKMGCNVIFVESEVQEFINKENIYNFETDGDYTLILDTDMVVMRTPKFSFDKEIYMLPEGESPNLPLEGWKSLFKNMDITFNLDSHYHFNGGAIFIKNNIKTKFYDIFIKNLDSLKELEKINRHYSVQYYVSAIFKNFDWGILDKRLNYFSRFLKEKDNIECDIVHYLGIQGFNKNVKKIIKEVEEEYEKTN